MLTSPNDLSITPPGTAHDAQIMAAFKTVGLQAFECRTEDGWEFTIIARSHADARYQCQRLCDVARINRVVVCTKIAGY